MVPNLLFILFVTTEWLASVGKQFDGCDLEPGSADVCDAGALSHAAKIRVARVA